MLTRIKIFPVSNYKQDDIYRNKNSSAFKKNPGHHHPFPWLSMTLAVFHDFPGLKNGLTKFHDFPGRVVTLHRGLGQKSPTEVQGQSPVRNLGTVSTSWSTFVGASTKFSLAVKEKISNKTLTKCNLTMHNFMPKLNIFKSWQVNSWPVLNLDRYFCRFNKSSSVVIKRLKIRPVEPLMTMVVAFLPPSNNTTIISIAKILKK